MILYGGGELHIEMLLANLRELDEGIEIITSEPIVSYLETVYTRSSKVFLTKLGNKLKNKLPVFLGAEPLTVEL